MENDKTHYRKAFNSPYLSSADIVEPVILTILRVVLEKDQTHKTKDSFNTAYFMEKEIRKGEPLKPMILNATNSRTMKDLKGTPYIDDWQNVPVTIYVDSNVRFGRDTVEGLRIGKEPPQLIKPELQAGTAAWKNAISAYCRDGNFDAIEKRMSISDDSKELIRQEAGDNVA
jgi:hypothetical protein